MSKMAYQQITAYINSCKERWQRLHLKLRSLRHRFEHIFTPLHLTSLNELSAYPKFNYQPTILKATQWSLEDSELKTVEVEVEFYPADVEVELHQKESYPSSPSQTPPVPHMVESQSFLSKDDLNRRITHFPPSHRLH